MSELATKLTRIEELLAKHNLDALLLQEVTNFAWATCGASSYVNIASNDSVAALLITPTGRHIFTNNVETPRLERGEGLKEQGW